MAGGMAQVIELLLSKFKALILNPSVPKQTNKQTKTHFIQTQWL
jgi:hypothetical protein